MTPPIVVTAASPCEPEAIRQALESALALLAAPEHPLPDPYQATSEHDRLVAVLAHNLAAGRYARACKAGGQPTLSLPAYAQRVAAGLSADWERVAGLRKGEAGLWMALLDELEQKAFRWLGPAGSAGWARAEAVDAAARTCADLWCWLRGHVYPFDVPFACWMARMLRNRLLEAARNRRVAARHIVDSVDRPLREDGLVLGDVLSPGRSDMAVDCVVIRDTVQRALARLERRQALVVRRWYLEGWPAAEIADSLLVTVSYVYTIKHRALRRLRTDPALL